MQSQLIFAQICRGMGVMVWRTNGRATCQRRGSRRENSHSLGHTAILQASHELVSRHGPNPRNLAGSL